MGVCGSSIQGCLNSLCRSVGQSGSPAFDADGESRLGPSRFPEQPINTGDPFCDRDGVEIV